MHDTNPDVDGFNEKLLTLDALIRHLLWLDTDNLNELVRHLGYLNVDGLARVDRQLDDLIDRIDTLIGVVNRAAEDICAAIYDAQNLDTENDAGPRNRLQNRYSTIHNGSIAQMQHDVQRRIDKARGEIR